MISPHDCSCRLHRRSFLSTGTAGIGSAVLASLVGPELFRGAAAEAADPSSAAKPKLDDWPGVVHPLHHAAKAKRVI